MHLAEASSTLFCLWTGLSLPVALHPASQRRSYLQLRTGQCFPSGRDFHPSVGAYFQAHIGGGTKVGFAPPSEPDWQVSCIRLSSWWLLARRLADAFS